MDIDTDPAITHHQMNEVMQSFNIRLLRSEATAPTVQHVRLDDFNSPKFKTSADRHFYLGEVFLATGNAEMAVRSFEAALEDYDGISGYDNFDIAVRLGLAECYAARCVNEPDKAFQVLDEILSKYPTDDRAHALKSRIYVRQGDAIKAYLSAMAALKVNSDNLEAACYLSLVGFLIAKAERNLSEMERSIDNLKIAQERFPAVEELPMLVKYLDSQFQQV